MPYRMQINPPPYAPFSFLLVVLEVNHETNFYFTKLQRIQNSAARLVSRSKKQNHITPILTDLHWLPIKARIQYKIILLTFNAVHGFAPYYIQNWSLHTNLHSPSDLPPSNSYKYPNREPKPMEKDFCLQCPTLWNSLPHALRSQTNIELFKKQLKTHLYKKCFM